MNQGDCHPLLRSLYARFYVTTSRVYCEPFFAHRHDFADSYFLPPFPQDDPPVPLSLLEPTHSHAPSPFSQLAAFASVAQSASSSAPFPLDFYWPRPVGAVS